MSTLFVNLVSAWDNKGVLKADKELANFGKSAQNVGMSLSKNISLPLAAIGAVGIKLAGDFQVTMNTLQVNAKASGEQMASLSALAKKMGADTVFSAGEAADAMLELSKGGLTVAEIEAGALQATMALAAAEGMGLAEASGIVVNTMNQFSLSAADAGMAVDLLAAGAVASTTSAEGLASGLKYVGTTAASLGISLNDTVTTLSALNNAGIDASTAGTSLNMFLLGLIPSSRKAAEEMSALGLSFTNTDGTMKSMEEIVALLIDTYGDMGDAAKAASLKQVFGIQGMRVANVLIEQGVEGYQELTAAVNEQGVAQSLADARMSGFNGSLEALKGSLETIALSVGEILIPAMQGLTDFFTELANKFNSLNPVAQQFIVIVGAAVAAIGPLLIVVGKLAHAYTSIRAVIASVQAAQIALNFAFLTNPIFLVVAAVVALIAIFVVAYNKIDWFRNFVDAAFEAIKNAIATAFNWVKENWPLLLGILTGPIGIAIAWVIKNWDKVTEFFKNFLKVATDIFKKIANAITAPFRYAFNKVADFWNDTIGKFKITIPDWVPLIGGNTFSFPKMPKIPELAEGGIVRKKTLAIIGEAGPEAVVPLSKGKNYGVGQGITINVSGALDPEAVARQIETILRRSQLRAGAY